MLWEKSRLQALMKIEFKYADSTEESVILTKEKGQEELMNFLNRLSDSGKRQWMAKIKNKDYPEPFQDFHYDWVIKRFENRN